MSKKCRSTHGGAGYKIGDTIFIFRYNDFPNINISGALFCKTCNYTCRAKPTGSKYHYYTFWENPVKYFLREVKFTEPEWPDFVTKKYIYLDRKSYEA